MLGKEDDHGKRERIKAFSSCFSDWNSYEVDGFNRSSNSYYEDQGLIQPERTAGNRRMYSLNDMDRLLEIKDFLDDGYNIAAIKHEYEEREVRAQQKQVALTDADVRRILHDELLQQGRFTTPSQQFGNLRI